MSWSQRWGLLGVSLIAAALAGELVLRLALPPPGFQPFGTFGRQQVVEPHPIRGHMSRPNLSLVAATRDYRVDIRTNDLGIRDDPLTPRERGEWRALAIGDSYTVGFGVQAYESWPEYLAQELGVNVVNAGVSAYSLRQMRQLAEEWIPRTQPDLMLAGVYMAGYRRVTDPFVIWNGGLVRSSRISELEPADGGALYSPFSREWVRQLDFLLKRTTYLGAYALSAAQSLRAGWQEPRRTPHPPTAPDPEEVRTRLAPFLDELGQLTEVAERFDVPLMIVFINGQQEDGTFDPIETVYNRLVARFLDERQVPWVDPLPDLLHHAEGQPIFRFAHDLHWTSAAHALVGTLVARRVRSEYLISQGARERDP